MSISSMLSIAGSGLNAAQTGLRTVSDNVANVGTPGYVRKVADQTSASAGGVGMGVSTAQLRLATDKFLQAAGLKAASDSGSAAVRSDMVDQAQSLFGDPNAATSFFNGLDAVFSAFTALSATPGATARAAAVGQVSSFLDQASSISSGLADLRSQGDSRLASDVDTANGLLKKIDGLNADISRAAATGADPTGAQETQSQLIDQLSKLLQLNVSARSQGGVTLRSSDGSLLAGDGAATLSYQPGDAGGRLFVTSGAGARQNLDSGSGEIAGLLQSRNVDLPALSAQLSELTTGVVDQLNAAHNASSSVPAPATLAGRNTGLPLGTITGDFSGKTTIAITSASGALVRAASIDFDANTITVNGATTAFVDDNSAPNGFLGVLNAALAPAGSASFGAGVLTLSATSAANGVAISDDAAAPARLASKGFSAFFGLNDLVTSSTLTDPATGLTAADANPLAASGALTLRMTTPDGAARDVAVALPAGGSVGGLVAALNSPATGVGLYGAFGLDASGKLSFTPNASGAALSVVGDTTQASASPTVNASTLFGLDPTRQAARAQTYAVRGDIAADPNRLALAKANLAVAAGAQALSVGDASGADSLAQAGSATRAFSAAGGVGATTLSVSTYAARIAAAVSSRAADAASASSSADAVATETAARRSGQEGVNLDQELISLTSYQQSYNASARLIQAAKDLYDTLLQMV